MTEVRCKVDSCEFWGRGDYCTAAEIWVKNSFAGDEDDDLFYLTGFEFAEDPEVEPERRTGGESASTSSQTCCKTMRPKEEKEGGGSRRGGCR